jgi:hypothetical protein
MQKTILALLSALLGIALLSACGGAKPVAPTATNTPDPCGPKNILAEVKKVNDLMREFDDDAQLASVASLNQMPMVIPPLQAVRRRAQDQAVPGCLSTLKSLQLQHMDAYINTLLVFMQSQGNNPDLIHQGITQSQTLHEQYNQELARLVGATYVPPSIPSATP